MKIKIIDDFGDKKATKIDTLVVLAITAVILVSCSIAISLPTAVSNGVSTAIQCFG